MLVEEKRTRPGLRLFVKHPTLASKLVKAEVKPRSASSRSIPNSSLFLPSHRSRHIPSTTTTLITFKCWTPTAQLRPSSLRERISSFSTPHTTSNGQRLQVHSHDQTSKLAQYLILVLTKYSCESSNSFQISCSFRTRERIIFRDLLGRCRCRCN